MLQGTTHSQAVVAWGEVFPHRQVTPGLLTEAFLSPSYAASVSSFPKRQDTEQATPPV